MSYGEYYCDHGIFAFYAHLPLTLDPSVPRIAITIIREQNETVPVHRLYVVVVSQYNQRAGRCAGNFLTKPNQSIP